MNEKEFVIFNGVEDEKEFLEKCIKQWELVVEEDVAEIIKIMRISTVFNEMKHRIADLLNEETSY